MASIRDGGVKSYGRRSMKKVGRAGTVCRAVGATVERLDSRTMLTAQKHRNMASQNMRCTGEWFERRLMLSAPVVTVSLNTLQPRTNDVLTATATKSDADGDPVSLTFVWKVDGIAKRTFTSATALTDTFDLSAPGNGDAGQTIAVEITPTVILPAPVALWDFENGTPGATATGNGTIRDSVGAHNGTPLGGPVYRTATSAGGVVGLNFDGVNDRVTIPDSPQLVLTHNLTLEANICLDRLASSFAYNQIIFRGDDRPGYDPYMLCVDSYSGKLVFRFDSPTGATSTISSPAALPVGTWLHVAATLDDATGRQSLYINGQQVASSITMLRPVGTLDASQAPGLGIGDIQSNTYNERFAGTIADVAISDSALSPGRFVLAPGGSPSNTPAIATAVVANSGPTAVALSSTSIHWNRPPGTAIGTLSTVDPDTAPTFTYWYSLVTGPGSADNASFSISGDQLTTATSLGSEGKSSYSIRVRATDSGGLWTEQAFTITVTNEAPVLSFIPDRYVNAGNTLTFTAVAFDPDVPADVLTYSLLNAPAGATIDGATGLFSWTPTEAQGLKIYTLTVQVTDGSLSDSSSFQVIVAGPNSAPVLAPIADQVVPEVQPLSLAVTASDADLPYQTLTYSLASGAPAGAAIDPVTGLFTWTPLEAQGPGTYPITIGISDGIVTTSQSFTITVTEVNTSPVFLQAIADQSVAEGNLLSFTATAVDSDIPAQTLTYSLASGAPAGAAIDPITGLFTWTPSEAQGPGTYPITIGISDGIVTTSQSFTITVTEVNTSPVFLQAIADQSVAEGNLLSFTATAVDSDIPAQTLTYSLSNAPAGAVIDPVTGLFAWTPSEAQGPGAHRMTIHVSDGIASRSETFQVSVSEVNIAPIFLQSITDQSVAEGNLLSFTATAVDSDIPAQTLTYSLSNAPAGAVIDPVTGRFAWTPSEAQGPGAYRMTIQVSDGITSNSGTFQVSVSEINIAPMLTTSSALSLPENQPVGTLVTTLTASDPDLPLNPLTYSLVPGPGSDDNACFTIQGNQLRTAVRFDYETKSSYSLRVHVADSGGLTDEKALTLLVTDLPEFGLLHGKSQKLTLTDRDGDRATFSLTGGGSGTIEPDGHLTLANTTAKSALSITLKKAKAGDGYYTLPGISADGLLKSLSAAKVLVTGDIALNAAAAPVGTSTTTLTLGGLRDASLDTHDLPLRSLKLNSWLDNNSTPDQLAAPWIGSVTATGDWQADILTTSSNRGVAISSMKVAGAIREANIWAADTLGSLTARGAIASSRIAAANGLASLSAASLQDSDILVGVSQSFAGQAATAFANPAAKLGKLTVTGTKLPKGQLHPAYLADSQISAPTYGTITLSNVPTGTAPFVHVLTDTGTLTLLSLSPNMLPAGTWKAGRPSKPGHERPNLVEVVS